MCRNTHLRVGRNQSRTTHRVKQSHISSKRTGHNVTAFLHSMEHFTNLSLHVSWVAHMELVLQQFFELVFIYGNSVVDTLVNALEDDKFAVYFSAASLILTGFAIYNAALSSALDEGFHNICIGVIFISTVVLGAVAVAFIYGLANDSLLSDWQGLAQHKRDMFVKGFTISIMVIAVAVLLIVIVGSTKKLVASLFFAFGFVLFYFDDGASLEESQRFTALALIGLIILLALVASLIARTSKNRRNRPHTTSLHFSKKRSLERHRERQLLREQRKAARAARISSKRRRRF